MKSERARCCGLDMLKMLAIQESGERVNVRVGLFKGWSKGTHFLGIIFPVQLLQPLLRFGIQLEGVGLTDLVLALMLLVVVDTTRLERRDRLRWKHHG
jgi:hypothetical protein